MHIRVPSTDRDERRKHAGVSTSDMYKEQLLANVSTSDMLYFWQYVSEDTRGNLGQVITHVPDGWTFPSNPPCVTQILSRAAYRTTTRVKDSLFPVGSTGCAHADELKTLKCLAPFLRLQLVVIRMSNDQSIFAWCCDGKSGRTGGVLANDPSFFRGCHEMELMDHDEIVRELKLKHNLKCSIMEDQVGVFPITNCGIQTWLPLAPLENSLLIVSMCREHQTC